MTGQKWDSELTVDDLTVTEQHTHWFVTEPGMPTLYYQVIGPPEHYMDAEPHRRYEAWRRGRGWEVHQCWDERTRHLEPGDPVRQIVIDAITEHIKENS